MVSGVKDIAFLLLSFIKYNFPPKKHFIFHYLLFTNYHRFSNIPVHKIYSVYVAFISRKIYGEMNFLRQYGRCNELYFLILIAKWNHQIKRATVYGYSCFWIINADPYCLFVCLFVWSLLTTSSRSWTTIYNETWLTYNERWNGSVRYQVKWKK